ncbi:MAG: FoF1 ATP synthase subunit gamma [Candidatus Limnocylindrales bacterium]
MPRHDTASWTTCPTPQRSESSFRDQRRVLGLGSRPRERETARTRSSTRRSSADGRAAARRLARDDPHRGAGRHAGRPRPDRTSLRRHGRPSSAPADLERRRARRRGQPALGSSGRCRHPGAGQSRNIKQITRAMQFVAASKLKRAQDADPRLAALQREARRGPGRSSPRSLASEDHPLLAEREGGKRLIVLITTDRGLAGPLNTNTIRFAVREITGAQRRPGRRHRRAQGPGRDAPRRGSRSRPTSRASAIGPPSPTSCRSRRLITDDFLNGTVQPDRHRLQPLRVHPDPAPGDRSGCCRSAPRRTRPGHPRPPVHLRARCRAPCSNELLPRYVATRLFQAVLEAKASEESSRMVAMKNATENAEDLIDDLTLSYNKVRQANITREMIEIASGAKPTDARDAGGRPPWRPAPPPAPAGSSRSPARSWTSSFPPASCRPSTTRSRSTAARATPLVVRGPAAPRQQLGPLPWP